MEGFRNCSQGGCVVVLDGRAVVFSMEVRCVWPKLLSVCAGALTIVSWLDDGLIMDESGQSNRTEAVFRAPGRQNDRANPVPNPRRMKSYKHQHGTKNPIIAQEEEAILLAAERALASTPNSQTIGRNGELPFLSFLQRYLPNTLRAVSGHFITPSGAISPQIDVIVVDARYPLLAQNIDGSALVMHHSVVSAIEIKTNLVTKDIKKSLAAASTVRALNEEIDEFRDDSDSCSGPGLLLMAYNCRNRLQSLESTYFALADPLNSYLDVSILRYHPSDREILAGALGGLLHLEPPFPEEKDGLGPLKDGYWPISSPSLTPLSDFYYRLVQDSYYTLACRDYDFREIGIQFNEYMSWSTAR